MLNFSCRHVSGTFNSIWSTMRLAKSKSLFAVLLITLLITGCDPITRHKVLSTVFDGVPLLPPVNELCSEYHEKQKVIEARKAVAGEDAAKKPGSSAHEPYVTKRCDDCHDKAKGTLTYPKQELCLSCHTDMNQLPFVHGPAAVGDCLVCHLPHTSSNPALLIRPRDQVCAPCHKEPRQAAAMHDRFQQRGVACADCHSPHDSNIRYFLY